MSYEIVKLKYLSQVPITNGLGLPGEHDNPEWPRYIRTTDIASPTSLRDDVFASQAPDVASKARVSNGDILMTAAGATIGKSVRLTGVGDACFAGFLVRYRPNNRVDGRFVAYWMQSQHYWDQISVGAVRSTIDNFSASKYRELQVPLPPVEEQRRIADFLDDQVARIDGVLADCRELDSQSEQAFQSAVIERTTYAVTGGTIATTGFPWKPFAESSWHIRPMRSFLRYAKDPVGENWKDYRLLSLTKKGVIPRDVESNFGKFPESFDTYQAVEPGDLVMCLFDVDETPRTVGLAHERGMVTGAYTRFVWTDPEISGRFVEYSLIGIDDQKAFRPLYTGMRKGIQTGRFLSARLPIPSNATQLSVVKALDERRQSMELFRTENARRSGLLEERKRALITAAVTGELDVTTAKPIGMGKWVPNVGAGVEAPAAAQASSIGGIG